MTIPNVVLGELIDPVTFGNAVVDAVNEHETEIADRLPLSGGTLTGALEVNNALYLAGGDEIARISAQPGAGRQVLSMFASGGSDIYDSPYISMYGKNDSNASNKGSILIYTSGDERIRVNNDGLQVDGKVQSSGGSETAPGVSLSGTKSGLWGGDAGIAIVVNQKQKLDCKPDRVVSRENFAAEKDAEVGGVLRANQNLTVPNGAVRLEGTVNGTRDVPTAPNFHVNASGWTFRSTWTPSRMAFAPSKLARNNDVLERAETATLPPDIETDDDGNQTNTAEVEGHDTVELFDVVTALLAKVKQLSGRIEALEGQKGL